MENKEIKKPNQNRKKIEQNEFIENGGVKKKNKNLLIGITKKKKY